MGLIAGLAQGGNSKIGIVTGLLVVAIADNVSDSFSIHIYKESEGASRREINLSTFGNFIVRLFLVFTFVSIVLIFSPLLALIVSSIWGLILLTVLSILIAKHKQTHPLREIIYHLIVALMVIVGSKLLGNLTLKMLTHL
jgi:VIT1/CCC1 family predicted Fe2+/Mn2+ transporter